MVYRALAEYLLHHAPKPHVRWWLFLPAVAMIMGAVAFMPHPAVLMLVSIFAIWSMVALNAWLSGKRRAQLSDAGCLGGNEWLATLAGFARAKQLESRSHPNLIEDLEACARLRQAILDALKSSEWERLSLQPEWADVRGQCQTSAQSLFDDALWAAKGAIRPTGARRETFARRCQDASFAAANLGAVRLARTQLEALLRDVHDDPFAGLSVRDALARSQTELEAVREAVAELGPMDRFLE